MIGKAIEIKTEFLDSGFVCDLQSEVNGFLGNNPDIEVIDIRYQMSVDEMAENKLYHVALIIYKEGEPA